MCKALSTKKSLNRRVKFAFAALSLTGLLSIVVSSWLYQELIYREDEIGLNHIVDVKYIELSKNLIDMMAKLGLRLQSENKFRRAIKKKNQVIINEFLNNEYHQYFVTAEMLNLQKIYLLDKKLQYIGESSEGFQRASLSSPICSQLSQIAKSRKGANRLKIISDLCYNNGRTFLSIIVPVGTLSPFAYLQVVVDPVQNLAPIEHALQLGLQIRLPSEEIRYESENWPETNEQGNFIFSELLVRNLADDVVLSILVSKPIAEFRDRFISTTILILSITGFLFIIVFFITLRSLKTGFNALSQLESGAHRVAMGDFKILAGSEYWELDTVIQSFNLMMGKIENNQYSLELEVKRATKDLNEAMQGISDKNSKLQIAMQLSEQASATKSTFLANMSHELRTPLNAIIGYSEMLKEDAENDHDNILVKDLDKIHSSGKHLLNLVNEILDLSKIEAGKVEIFVEEFDLIKVINEVVATAKPLSKINQNKLALTLSSDSLMLKSDVMRIKQIFFNLVSNACKFTKNGNIDITVEENHNGEEYQYLVSVKDTGIGLKDTDLPKLFTAFTQADISTTKKFGGTGLGLALSKQLVELLGGNIKVISVYGKGSEFIVQLPKNYSA